MFQPPGGKSRSDLWIGTEVSWSLVSGTLRELVVFDVYATYIFKEVVDKMTSDVNFTPIFLSGVSCRWTKDPGKG